MSAVQVAPMAHQEVGKIATLSGHKDFTVKAHRVIKSGQPGRVALHQKFQSNDQKKGTAKLLIGSLGHQIKKKIVKRYYKSPIFFCPK